MPLFPPVSEQLTQILRGVVDLQTRAELEQRLQKAHTTGKPLRIKAGFDPTRPDLHLGHAVLLTKLRQFQDMGHTAILLIGEFTATVGDPTGQNELRPRLSSEEVRTAAATYTEQALKILDPTKIELRSNAEWLANLPAAKLVELMAHSTVARMLERNDFALRFRTQQPIFQHEFLYPLLQGYDSVVLDCDIELGGTDQLFNLLVGRDLMQKHQQTPQLVMTLPLLEGTDAHADASGRIVGKKMSKSIGNAIGIQEEPLSMYRKIMQLDDLLAFRYLELLSTRDTQAIHVLREEVQNGRHPMEIKSLLGRELVERFHSREAAEHAATAFSTIYAHDALPSGIAEHVIPTEGDTLWIAKALSSAGLVSSTAEGKRLVEQGGVELDQVRMTDATRQLPVGARYLVRVGSKHRRFAYIKVISSMATGLSRLFFLSLIALLCCVGGIQCVQPRPLPSPTATPSPPTTLHVDPLTDLVAASRLRGMVVLSPHELLAQPEFAAALSTLIPDDRFDTFAKQYGGVNLRTLEELVFAFYPDSKLVLGRGPLHAKALLQAFEARAIPVEGKGEDFAHTPAHSPLPAIPRIWGIVHSTRCQLATLQENAFALETGTFGPLRIATLFAQRRLSPQESALHAVPLQALAALVSQAPLYALMPGPFQGSTMYGLGGLLEASTAVGLTLTPLPTGVRSGWAHATLFLLGSWQEQDKQAGQRLIQWTQGMFQSPFGRLLRLNRSVDALQVEVTKDWIKMSLDIELLLLTRSLHAATGARWDEILDMKE